MKSYQKPDVTYISLEATENITADLGSDENDYEDFE